MALRPEFVPPALAHLVLLAAEWDIGDDFERSEAVRAAPVEHLRALARSVDAVEDPDLYEWLAGEESFRPDPSPEYIAFSNMALALDEARLRLRREGRSVAEPTHPGDKTGE